MRSSIATFNVNGLNNVSKRKSIFNVQNLPVRYNNRLTSALHSLIGNKQNGFIKGRYIGHNIRLLFDFIDYMDHNDDPGTLLSLDMCEVIDSLKWDFIFKVFESYGFGNYLNNWLKTIYQFPKVSYYLQ